MAEKRLILAHDLGTTGNKASLYDAYGALLGSAFAGYDTDYPQPNWAEQNPDDWWQAVCNTSRQLLAETGADPHAIAAIGFSGQMMGCVPIDAAGHPLRSCIIWADTRAQAQAQRLAELGGSSRIYRTVGHPASPAYSAPKILWVRDEQPEMARAALEGVALHLRLILDALSEQVPGIQTMRVIGGGTRSPLWRQILADSFSMPVHTLDLQAGATSWGAAVAAGVGVGLYDWSIANERIRVIDVTEPNPDDMAFYDELAGIFADTYSALEPIYERLARLT